MLAIFGRIMSGTAGYVRVGSTWRDPPTLTLPSADHDLYRDCSGSCQYELGVQQWQQACLFWSMLSGCYHGARGQRGSQGGGPLQPVQRKHSKRKGKRNAWRNLRVATREVRSYLPGESKRYILLLKVAFQPASFQLCREKKERLMAQSQPKLWGACKHRIILKKAGCLTDGSLTRLIFPLTDYGGVRGGLTTPRRAVNWKLAAHDITVPRTKRETGLENGRANARLGLILLGDSSAGGET